ncbi:MAG TPA: protein kinase [Candidatus Polarisedimenticolia bacterium]|nr:protein kinase [Candidatus Polarisedimenticolia bacterium]
MATIGRYIVERELGRGAMGRVCLATDPHLGRKVAVKTYVLPDGVSPELAAQFHERFLREARAAASLSHPGLVTVFDAGEDEASSRPFIAMEFVDGRSLKERLEEKGRLDAAWVLDMGSTLAEALGVAHRAGIVHRDIKPANILIREEDGAAKLADFGVAHLKSSELTQTGTAPGSPGYMSPEQIQSGEVDGRSDLFSLAVVLYEALSGRRPFRGDDLVALTYSIAHETQVPLSRHLRDCPPALDQFFDRALSKDPTKRFGDAKEFRAALVAAAQAKGPEASERTILEAESGATTPLPGLTIPLPPAAAGAAVGPEPAAKRPAPPAAGPARRGGRRFAALSVAAIALLAAAGAAVWLGLGRPDLLRAGSRASKPATTAANVTTDPGTPLPRREDILAEVTPVPEPPPRRQPEPRRPAPATPPRPPSRVSVTLPAGTDIDVVLDTALSSAASFAGDAFTARVVHPVLDGDRVVIPAGSTVRGQVSAVMPAKRGLRDKGGSLTLSFDRLQMPDGTGAALAASLTRAGGTSGKKTAGAVGGGAVGGALLGKILGGTSKDAAAGSVVGAAIGTGVAAGTRGEDVDLSRGAPLTVQLGSPLTLSIRR